jgi:hypothetical protein
MTDTDMAEDIIKGVKKNVFILILTRTLLNWLLSLMEEVD